MYNQCGVLRLCCTGKCYIPPAIWKFHRTTVRLGRRCTVAGGRLIFTIFKLQKYRNIVAVTKQFPRVVSWEAADCNGAPRVHSLQQKICTNFASNSPHARTHQHRSHRWAVIFFSDFCFIPRYGKSCEKCFNMSSVESEKKTHTHYHTPHQTTLNSLMHRFRDRVAKFYLCPTSATGVSVPTAWQQVVSG